MQFFLVPAVLLLLSIVVSLTCAVVILLNNKQPLLYPQPYLLIKRLVNRTSFCIKHNSEQSA